MSASPISTPTAQFQRLNLRRPTETPTDDGHAAGEDYA